MECFQQSPHAGVRAISTLAVKQTLGSFSVTNRMPQDIAQNDQEPTVKKKCLDFRFKMAKRENVFRFMSQGVLEENDDNKVIQDI